MKGGEILDTYYIGEKLKKARNTRNLTAEQLAELTDLSPESIWQLEGNKRSTTLDTLLKISKALSVSPSYFITDTSDNSNIELLVSEYTSLFETLDQLTAAELSLFTDIAKTTIKNRKQYRNIE